MGMTAIAAVLALSSTPLAAQEAPSLETAPAEAPPAETISTPEPLTEPTADPLAPEPVAEPGAPVETTAAEAEPADASPAEPASEKPAAKAARTAPRTSAPAPDAEPTVAASSAPEASAPIPTAAIEAPPQAGPPVSQPEPTDQIEEALPVAGGAGALILALAGAGMAVRRRKRRDEDEMVDRQAFAESTEAALAEEPAPAWSEPVIEPKPALVIPANMQTSKVPETFDTSNFGRHVQAAYRGPTPENPSLSLRKRLKIAGELDRRERKLGTAMPRARERLATASISPTEKPVMSFSATPTHAKRPDYQL